ncbi:MAG TPA: hypothetical protein VJV79_31025 [Polyangiaceae bacterium]|nr:hypothetical protein [Polyangiaceae bacterium]
MRSSANRLVWSLSCCFGLLGSCNRAQRAPESSNTAGTAAASGAAAIPPASVAAPPAAPPTVDVVCQEHKDTLIPKADGERAAGELKLAGCDAEAAYYGLGAPLDPRRARLCALGERGTDGSFAITNAEVLMMIYANGLGVPKDYDLAIRFACQAGGAPAELSSRIARLLAARDGNPPSTPFDQCDDASSGLLVGRCAELQERRAASTRQSRLLSATTGMPKAEVEALKRAARLYFQSRSQREIDRSGTQAAGFVIAERTRLEDDFVRTLEQVREPSFAPPMADPHAVDASLAALLARIKSCASLSAATQPLPGMVQNTGIAETQRHWLEYRQAFVQLALKLHPSTPTGAWSAWVAGPRLDQLSELATGC